MHEAYEAIPVLEKLPLQIESIFAYDANLVVGTRQGHLLMYSVTPGTTQRWDVSLVCSNKNFSRRPIVQVAVVPEHQIIISLSDNIISVHDLTAFNIPLLSIMTQTKGATAFDLDIQRTKSLTGETAVTVRLVVAVKRRLQLYYWKGRQFHQLRDDLSLPDTPRAITWCLEAIAVAFKQEYWLVQLDGEQKELFATGRSQEPLITKLDNIKGDNGSDQLALAHDKETIFVDSQGNASCSYTLKWDEQPIALAFHKPYLIAVLSKTIEIKTSEPHSTVQILNLDKPRLITVSSSCKGDNHVYVASISHIWCLHDVPINQQIPQLLHQKQFALALKLVDVWNEADDAKSQMYRHIQHLHAIHLFCTKQYNDAMNIFIKHNTDLPFVIGLYPDMVPEEYHSRLQYPYPPPTLTGSDLEVALEALITFLLEMRRTLSISDTSTNIDSFGKAPSPKSRSEKLQIIDTTLLKCYLKTKDSLVSSLLRMPECQVSAVEGERVLRHAHRYQDLVLLLRTRGHHQRALNLLLRHSKKPESPLCGHQHTVTYLQQLGSQHIDVIFEYGAWVLQSHPQDGLKIFIGDANEVGEMEQLPRSRVLSFLKKTEKSLIVPYLEHVIHEWGDRTPLLHNELIHEYRNKILEPMKSSDPTSVEEEKGRRREVQEKLLKFLNESEYYTAATLLVHFPYDTLHRERAVLLGRLVQHQQALMLYIHTLNDIDAALKYCQTHYNPTGSGNEVYLILLKLLVSPADKLRSPSASPMKQPGGSKPPDIEAVLKLLHKYLHCIDLSQALKVLPDNVSLSILKPFIHTSLSHASANTRHKQITRGLTHSLRLQTNEELVECQKLKIVLSEYTYCSVCRKRFTKHSAFAWYPNGDIVHFSCQNQR